MKRLISLLSAVVAIAFLMMAAAGIAYAQRYVDIPQGVGNLNNHIMGDTTAAGARVDLNTIYRLQRGGFYPTTATIGNTFPLHIEAAAGTGAKPVIYAQPVAGGTASRPFGPKANLTLKGLYISGLDGGGAPVDNTIRTAAEKIRFVIDDCHLEQDKQAGIRLENKDCKVFMTNTTISNVGIPADPDNGRGIDFRNNNQDSIYIQNCTFYNLTSRVIRNPAGITNYFFFDHNTVFNVGQRGMMLQKMKTVVMTNNIFVNMSFYGRDTTSVTSWSNQLDTTGISSSVSWRISNNNTYLTDSVRNKILSLGRAVSPLWDTTATKILALSPYASTNTSSPISFTAPPVNPLNVIQDWYTNSQLNPANRPWQGVLTYPYEYNGVPYNLAYSTTAPAYTGSSMKQPLGDLRWFNMKPVLSSVERTDPAVPASFDLADNYPNPFNPETSIRYRISQASHVTLSIYNALGQRVATLVDQGQLAGTYTARWDGTTNMGMKVSSGVYCYRLEAGNSSIAKKMLLVK